MLFHSHDTLNSPRVENHKGDIDQEEQRIPRAKQLEAHAWHTAWRSCELTTGRALGYLLGACYHPLSMIIGHMCLECLSLVGFCSLLLDGLMRLWLLPSCHMLT